MAKHSDTSWKQDHPSTLFSNSVQKADRLLKHAKSHPEEIAIEHAFNQIKHAENARSMQNNMVSIWIRFSKIKEYLEQIKQQLHEMKNDTE